MVGTDSRLILPNERPVVEMPDVKVVSTSEYVGSVSSVMHDFCGITRAGAWFGSVDVKVSEIVVENGFLKNDYNLTGYSAGSGPNNLSGGSVVTCYDFN
jgi:hypothetical protein